MRSEGSRFSQEVSRSWTISVWIRGEELEKRSQRSLLSCLRGMEGVRMAGWGMRWRKVGKVGVRPVRVITVWTVSSRNTPSEKKKKLVGRSVKT